MTIERKLRKAVGSNIAKEGQQGFVQVGTHSFVVPAGVTSISAVCVGAGGGSGGASANSVSTGGGGGALSYSNNIPVTPGETLTVVVGNGGLGGTTAPTNGTAGGDTSISRGATTLVLAKGGGAGLANSNTIAAGGQASAGVGDVRQSGGASGRGGGGAAGYSGTGGAGVFSGTGGSGSGGGGGGASVGVAANAGSSGGGVNIYGEGASGAGGVGGSNANSYGQGGSGGVVGSIFGAGNGGEGLTVARSGKPGLSGAARIIWGAGRQFPSTNVADIGVGVRGVSARYNQDGNALTVPSNTQPGDLIFVFQGFSGTGAPPNPTGYTAIHTVTNSGGIGGGLYYRVAVAGDAGSTISPLNLVGGSSHRLCLVISSGNLLSSWSPVIGSLVTNTTGAAMTVTSGSGQGPLAVIGASFGFTGVAGAPKPDAINTTPIPLQMTAGHSYATAGAASGLGGVVLNKGQEQDITFTALSAAAIRVALYVEVK